MKIIFGIPTCPDCIKLKKELEEKNEEFIYYDITESEGLAEAAFRGVFDKADKKLPIIIEE